MGNVCIHMYMYAHTCTYVRICTYVYNIIYYMYAHTHTHTHTHTRARAHAHTVVILTRLSSYQSISLLRFTVVIIRMLSSSTLVGYPTTKDKVRVRPTTGRTEGEGCSCIYHSPSFLWFLREYTHFHPLLL